MKNERLLHILGQIDDAYIEEAAPVPKPSHTRLWTHWITAAACLILTAGITMFLLPDHPVISPTQTAADSSQMAPDGIIIPPYNLNLSSDETLDMACMVAFFIYEGRSYVAYETLSKDVDFVGDYLGTSTGLIDAWTPKDGYIDFAGSIRGDIYSVDGYNPEFMLCMRAPTGTVTTYINDNGITLHKGSELFEDRLQITGHIQDFYYQLHDDWYYSRDHYLTLSEDDFSVVEDLLSSLNDLTFIWTNDVALPEQADSIYDTQLAHLFLELENQMTVHLRLFEGGYISFDGLRDVCLKADDIIFNQLAALLTSPASALTAEIEDSDPFDLTYEDCLILPEFGQYVPSYIPADTYTESTQIIYEIDQPSGDLIDTAVLSISQSGEDFWYRIRIAKTAYYPDISHLWTALYNNEEPLPCKIDQKHLSLETFLKYGNPEQELTNSSEPGRLSTYLQFDDMIVLLDSYRLDAQTAYYIMKSLID